MKHTCDCPTCDMPSELTYRGKHLCDDHWTHLANIGEEQGIRSQWALFAWWFPGELHEFEEKQQQLTQGDLFDES